MNSIFSCMNILYAHLVTHNKNRKKVQEIRNVVLTFQNRVLLHFPIHTAYYTGTVGCWCFAIFVPLTIMLSMLKLILKLNRDWYDLCDSLALWFVVYHLEPQDVLSIDSDVRLWQLKLVLELMLMQSDKSSLLSFVSNLMNFKLISLLLDLHQFKLVITSQ